MSAIHKDQSNMYVSILDRLVDSEPLNTHESVQSSTLSFKQIEASVIKHLERLLNTRQNITPVPAGYNEIERSVFTYGLPDFTGENPNSDAVQRKLRQTIEKTIAKFEPRLKNIHVRTDKDPDELRKFAFRIIGKLVLEPLNEPIAFDTYFDTRRSEYVISR